MLSVRPWSRRENRNLSDTVVPEVINRLDAERETEEKWERSELRFQTAASFSELISPCENFVSSVICLPTTYEYDSVPSMLFAFAMFAVQLVSFFVL